MKHSNFTPLLSPEQQKELYQWFIGCILIIIISITALACYFGPSIYTLISIKKEIKKLQNQTSDYSSISSNYSHLKKNYAALKQRKDRIDRYLNNPKNPHDYVAAIFDTCKNGIEIESISNNNMVIHITLVCPTTESATHIAELLCNTGYFSDAKISSLQQDKKETFTCTIKATMKKI